MTDERLAELFADALTNAPPGEKTNTYVLFGVKYAGELGSTRRVKRVVQLCREQWPEAGASGSSGTDVGYGMRVAPYVEFRGGVAPSWIS